MSHQSDLLNPKFLFIPQTSHFVPFYCKGFVLTLILTYQLGMGLMNTKKVFYLLIILALIYNMMLMFADNNDVQADTEKATLNIRTNLIESR